MEVISGATGAEGRRQIYYRWGLTQLITKSSDKLLPKDTVRKRVSQTCSFPKNIFLHEKLWPPLLPGWKSHLHRRQPSADSHLSIKRLVYKHVVAILLGVRWSSCCPSSSSTRPAPAQCCHRCCTAQSALTQPHQPVRWLVLHWSCKSLAPSVPQEER